MSLEDLLEEIVGKIKHETDSMETPAPIQLVANGVWQADGLAYLGDIERVVGMSVADDLDANSLSGLIMRRLERMPQAGDEHIEAGFKLTVESLKDLRAGRARIRRIETKDQPTSEDNIETY